jgi:sugar O-acyltransferase (sialic acid O-acetyltransferase NeuD family)
MKPIIIWGGTGHAKVLEEFLPSLGYALQVIFDNDPTINSPIDKIPIIHGEKEFQDWLRGWSGGKLSCAVAIGGERGRDRVRIQCNLQDHGIQPDVLVHPSAIVSRSAVVGIGSQVLMQAAVCADAKLGSACIVNTQASVDHECVLGEGVHLGPGATLSGCVKVGDCAFIGSGATILPRVRIGADAVVGAGAVVTHDVPPRQVVVGNPARFLRMKED